MSSPFLIHLLHDMARKHVGTQLNAELASCPKLISAFIACPGLLRMHNSQSAFNIIRALSNKIKEFPCEREIISSSGY